jgi:integrase
MADPKRARITKRLVDALEPGQVAWDTDVRGFGVRCQRQAKVYVLKATIHGRQRWITIGEHGSPWTPDTARHEAQRLWGAIRSGTDPTATRNVLTSKPTMGQLCERYLQEHARQHKKPRSIRTDESNIRNHILPLLGALAVSDISQADIDRFKRAVRDGETTLPGASRSTSPRGGAVVAGGPGIANRCVSLLSKMFNLAERWGWRSAGTNPVRHVEKYRETKRERYLSPDEIERLGAALDQAEASGSESPYALAALRLLLLTGARLSEVLSLRWEWVDVSKKIIWLPDSKTGQKPIFLSEPAMHVLEALPRIIGNPHVICGSRPSAHLVNLHKPWQRICTASGLTGIRLHDLRHSFASAAVASGLTLPVIGKLLGHKRTETTARYSHLADDPLRAASDHVGRSIASALNRASNRADG